MSKTIIFAQKEYKKTEEWCFFSFVLLLLYVVVNVHAAKLRNKT